jgi:hypothetical protein
MAPSTAIDDLGFDGGTVRLVIDDTGQRLAVGPVGTAGMFDNSIDLLSYRYNLTLTGDVVGCAAGTRSLYQGTESKAPGSDLPRSLEFVALSEGCGPRAELLVRTWTREGASAGPSAAP